MSSVEPEQAIPDLLEFVEMHDLMKEGDEGIEALTASRKKRSVDPPATEELEAPIVEDALTLAIVADVLGDLVPEEVIESQPGVDGETGTPKVLPSIPEETRSPLSKFQSSSPSR